MPLSNSNYVQKKRKIENRKDRGFPNLPNSIKSGLKEFDHTRETFHKLRALSIESFTISIIHYLTS